MNIIKKLNKTQIWEILPELSVDEIEEAIKVASDYYYNTETPLISDETYDILVERLRDLYPNSDIFKKIGAPIKGKKVKLPYWMGSMNKLKDDKGIEEFVEENPGNYLISDKLDGVSGLLCINGGSRDNIKFKLFTRGDGEYGQDISHLLSLINIINFKDILKEKKEYSIRGELIMSKKNFEKYADTVPNARNMVAGIVNSKVSSLDPSRAADVDFVAYELIEPKLKPSEQMKLLKSKTFDVAHSEIYEDIDQVILDDILKKRKEKSKYEIDGIIVNQNEVHSRNTSGNPSYSFAWKGVSQAKITTVLEVIWSPGKDGHLIPRIHYKAVQLGGVTLQYTTGFNARYINQYKIGPGAKIKVIRSGDTIPYIMEITEPAKKPSFPDEDYEWDKNKVNIVLTNPDDNETVIITRLTKFVRDIGVENMSEGIVTKLVNGGYNTIPKIMQLTVDDLLELEGFGKTLAEKLINNLKASLSELDILTLMVASNCFGRGFGERKIRKILDVYPDIVTVYDNSKKKEWIKKIIGIAGFDTISAEKFLSMLPNFQKFYKIVKKITPIKKYVVVESGGNIFENEAVVFTGFREESWKKFIEKEGGRVSSDVSRNTTLLIYADGKTSSGSYVKAVKLGITVISRSEFAAKFGPMM